MFHSEDLFWFALEAYAEARERLLTGYVSEAAFREFVAVNDLSFFANYVD